MTGPVIHLGQGINTITHQPANVAINLRSAAKDKPDEPKPTPPAAKPAITITLPEGTAQVPAMSSAKIALTLGAATSTKPNTSGTAKNAEPTPTPSDTSSNTPASDTTPAPPKPTATTAKADASAATVPMAESKAAHLAATLATQSAEEKKLAENHLATVTADLATHDERRVALEDVLATATTARDTAANAVTRATLEPAVTNATRELVAHNAKRAALVQALATARQTLQEKILAADNARREADRKMLELTHAIATAATKSVQTESSGATKISQVVHSIKAKAQVFTSHAELTSQFHLAFDGSVIAPNSTFALQAEVSQTTRKTNFELFYVLSVVATEKREQLVGPYELTAAAIQQLQQPQGVAHFATINGDAYTTSITSGSGAYVVIRFSCTTQEKQRKLAASLAAKAALEKISANVRVGADSTLRDAFSNTNYDITYQSFGLNDVSPVGTLKNESDIDAMLIKIQKSLESGKTDPVPIAFTTQPYATAVTAATDTVVNNVIAVQQHAHSAQQLQLAINKSIAFVEEYLTLLNPAGLNHRLLEGSRHISAAQWIEIENVAQAIAAAVAPAAANAALADGATPHASKTVATAVAISNAMAAATSIFRQTASATATTLGADIINPAVDAALATAAAQAHAAAPAEVNHDLAQGRIAVQRAIQSSIAVATQTHLTAAVAAAAAAAPAPAQGISDVGQAIASLQQAKEKLLALQTQLHQSPYDPTVLNTIKTKLVTYLSAGGMLTTLVSTLQTLLSTDDISLPIARIPAAHIRRMNHNNGEFEFDLDLPEGVHNVECTVTSNNPDDILKLKQLYGASKDPLRLHGSPKKLTLHKGSMNNATIPLTHGASHLYIKPAEGSNGQYTVTFFVRPKITKHPQQTHLPDKDVVNALTFA